jgi:hypothetical protein
MRIPINHSVKTLRKRRYRYNTRLIRRDLSYTIQEVAGLFWLHPNAVRRWLKAGLRRIDNQKPHLIHGSDLINFLNERQLKRKRHCQPGEMFCFRCREPRLPAVGSATIDHINERKIMARGVCELCGTRMNRGALVERLAAVQQAFNVTAAPQRLEETSDAVV